MQPFLEPILSWLRFKKIEKYIPEGSRVCDIGCGREGSLLLKMSSRIKYGVGYDKKVEELNAGNISLKRIQLFSKIDEPSGSFDRIIMLAVLEHMEEPLEILKECFRMLDKGGAVLITVPTPQAKPVLEFLAYKVGIVSSVEIRDHKTYFDQKKLSEFLVRAGFEKEKIFCRRFEFGFNLFAKVSK